MHASLVELHNRAVIAVSNGQRHALACSNCYITDHFISMRDHTVGSDNEHANVSVVNRTTQISMRSPFSGVSRVGLKGGFQES